MEPLVAQTLPPWRRAVLKVGSSLLAADRGGLTARHVAALAGLVAASRARGREIVLVSSGAVAAGRALLRGCDRASDELAARQALASLGQVPMVALWQSLSKRPVAQVLLTHDDLRNRRRYLNARATLRELLCLDVLPIVNENDAVAVDELKLGDNDNLAAIVAALVDADLLLIASDVNALYTRDPQRDPHAKPVTRVDAVTPAIMAMAGGRGSVLGTGGMRTKLEAARNAAAAGIPTALFDGRDAAVAGAIADGTLYGALFCAASGRVQARKYWLQHAPAAVGRIRVDAGAARALASGRASLLPSGVADVEGEVLRGDLVEVMGAGGVRVARGLSHYNAAEVRRIKGRQSREIPALLGYSYGGEVMHRDDLVAIADAVPVEEP